jgi:hypothetical protein
MSRDALTHREMAGESTTRTKAAVIGPRDVMALRNSKMMEGKANQSMAARSSPIIKVKTN